MYDARIGLEVHVELATQSKMFCSCANRFQGEPNSRCCPICLGLPGALPAVNEAAVRLGVRAALAFGARINTVSYFDRKQYSYPDLPKGYQITQYFSPFSSGGSLRLSDGSLIRIHHIHLEEDAGKLIHDSNVTKVDFNRCGVPLIEIVLEPDIKSPRQAREAVMQIHETLVALKVTDGRMQEGSMRADVNVSILQESGLLGERTELKNVSGFRAVEHAAEYEMKRQIELLSHKMPVERETRRWNEAKKVSELMRSKEALPDYRYFKEPDLPPLSISSQMIEEGKRTLFQLPERKKTDIMAQYSLNQKSADYLFAHPDALHYFEAACRAYPNSAAILTWIMGELLVISRDRAVDSLPPLDAFLRALTLVEQNKISRENAKNALYTAKNGDAVDQYIERNKLWQNAELTDDIRRFMTSLRDSQPALVQDYRNGKTKALAFFMGQTLKAFPRTDPKRLKEAWLEELSL